MEAAPSILLRNVRVFDETMPVIIKDGKIVENTASSNPHRS